MRLVSERLLRSLSAGGGAFARPPAPPHALCSTVTAAPPDRGPTTDTQPTLALHTLSPLSRPPNTARLFITNTSFSNDDSDILYTGASSLLFKRNAHSVQQTRLVHCPPSEPTAEFTQEERAGPFSRVFSRKVIWVVGFFAGMVLGAGFRLSSSFSLKPRVVDTNMIQIPDEEDEEEGGSLVPAVRASKGFFAPSSAADEDNNNNSGVGGKGSGPPKHRAHFNFLADIVERLEPSVVFIEILDMRRTDASGHALPINNGSGFVVDSSGYVLTNAHVVTNRPRASRVMIRLHDGRELPGTLEEVDPYSDLALIKINATGLVPAPMGNSSDIRPGEFVVALGAPLSLSNTVTAGVVSSVRRCARDLGIRANDINYIQTDAAITFGNSGGPLANLDGDVIGINSMKATAGISFAIPVDTAKEFLAKAAAKRAQALKKRDSSPSPHAGRRAYIGITMLSLTKEIIAELQARATSPLPSDLEQGVLVWRVVIGSPAYHAGLQPGDVITLVNGHEIKAASDVYRLLEKPSDLTMVVLRGNNRYSVTITPEE